MLSCSGSASDLWEEHRQEHAAEVSRVYETALQGYAAKIPRDRVAQVKADPRVQFVQQDKTVVAFEQQTKPTGVDRVEADLSNTAQKDPVNVNVAILDSGIDKTHPDLQLAGGRNFATFGKPNDNYEDGLGHGTHVAGTVGAKDNDFGAIGVAPGAPLYGVKVLDNYGRGTDSWIIAGIDWVAARGPKTNTNTKLRDDAASWADANGFTGDPNTNPINGRYYGYLGHADGY